MRRLRYVPLPPLLVSLLVPVTAFAAPWKQDNAFFTENASLLSSKVDAADLNGDKLIDVVFANGAGYDKGDNASDQAQQAFIQDAGVMTDVSSNIFGVGATFNGRAVKIRDIDYDGDNDILLGTTWVSQSQLFLNDGGGAFTNVTDPNLPANLLSIGDVEVGDVDYDGDLDILLANWGTDEGSVAQTEGGITRLWSQTDKPGMFGEPGTGMFEDVTLAQMPNVHVRWSWELEFVDVDNDWDLDILVSAYAGDKASLFLFTNDGNGTFVDATAGNITQGKYALDVEAIDLTNDGFMDLLTLHDGVSGRNRLLINDKKGKFTDSTDVLWPKLDNPSSFDFSAGFYDHDSNHKVDWVMGAIETAQIKYPDRLIYESGGKYAANKTAFEQMPASAGTYSIVLADFNQDFKLDVAMAQNENATQKKILLATDEIPVDSAAPIFPNYEKLPDIDYPGTEVIRVRCHDNKSPLMQHDFQDAEKGQDGRPYLESWADDLPADPDMTPGTISDSGQWYGEYLWRVSFEVPDADVLYYRLCAIDAAGNKACTKVEETNIIGGSATESDSQSATETDTATATATDTNATDSGVTVTASATDSDSMSASNTDTQGTISATEPTESASASDSVTASDTVPTETNSASDTATPGTASATATATESDTIESADQLDDDGCGCDADSSPAGALGSLALLGLLGIRRRRKA
ncbi:MAG: VCBS repeat-containing protein [Nannocystis sp.]|uniref:FG-GAP repeat domain-containing protein n=1 Tax=Nannocystis sp. TaxID=1962667 RepID=UPI002425F19A|nr:VCBS repeat-containing protein [Nannocystis sp.]MBK9753577.1 VCBS repeat-containing protein [Nannocystis sp.]